jgi:hypothetical protein
VFVVAQDLNGFGELGDLAGIAADLVEDRPLFELGEHALAGSAEPGVEPVVLLLPLRFVSAFERCGHEIVVESVVAFVAQREQAVLGQQARELPDSGGFGVVDGAADSTGDPQQVPVGVGDAWRFMPCRLCLPE